MNKLNIESQCDIKKIIEAVKNIKIASCVNSVNSVNSVKSASEILNAERNKLITAGFNDVDINNLIIDAIS